MAEPYSRSNGAAVQSKNERVISLAKEMIREYQLTDLQPLLESIERQSQHQSLNVAVFGRFNSGKSSFLNHLLGRPILPVGVVPVTSVVTEISYAPQESAEVLVRPDREIRKVPLIGISAYISELENPGNWRGVETVRVFVPDMAPYQGLRLIDTPGLESIFALNAEASLAWSPNTDLALVAVGVDPPLTQQDVSLIERLQRFTPNVSVLLTKMDLLSPAEQQEVLAFVISQLRAKFPGGVNVFPFSTKPGYEGFHKRLEKEYLAKTLAMFQEEHFAALARKLHTLLSSAAGYLQLALKAIEAKEEDYEMLRREVLGSQSSLADTELQFRLVAKHAAARTRPAIERHLKQNVLSSLQKTLEERFAAEFPRWRGSFANVLGRYEKWIRGQLKEELSVISEAERRAFLEPVQDMERQCHRILQRFRDQLSEKVFHTFGVSLRTSEMEIEVQPPRAPDIDISRVFDHNWELLSALIPMLLVRGLVRRRFEEKVEGEVFKNLSRLTSQWEEAIHAAIRSIEKEALRRFEELVLTVRRLIARESTQRNESIQGHLKELRAEIEHLSKG
jgi:GTP-binding protein EngB required for normal cell division